MRLPSQRWLTIVLLATALVFLGVATYLYGLHFFAWIESDASVPALLAAKVLQAKLPVVGDWYYANGDVWVLAPHLLAILPVAVLGLSPVSLLVAVVTGFVVEVVALARLYARLCGERWVGLFAAMVTLMAWSQAHVAFMYIQLAYGFLTVVYLLVFGAFGVLAESAPARPGRWVAAGLFVALVAVQNPTRGLAFVLAPILVGCVWPWRGFGLRSRLAAAAAAAAGWAIASVVYTALLQHLVQFSVPSGHIDFVLKDADGIVDNLGMLARGLAVLSGGTDEPSARAVPGVLVMAGAIALACREVFAARAITALRFVSVVVLAQLAGVLVPLLAGNLLVSPSSVRYLMPSLLAVFGLAAMLAVRTLGEADAWRRRLATGWLVLIPVAALLAAPSARPPVPEKYVWPNARELHHVAKELGRRGVTHGFSSVLNANILNLEANGRSTTCPVYFANVLVPQRWLADTSCYVPAALGDRFYVVTDHDDRDEAALRASLPAPVERFHVGKTYEISVFRTTDTSLAWFDLPLPDGDHLALPLRLPATHLQLHRGAVAAEAGKLVATGHDGYVVYGPYLRLPKGTYEVVWRGHGVDSPGEITFAVDVRFGQEVLARKSFPAREIGDRAPLVELSFTLDRMTDVVEFPVFSAGGARIALDELVLEKR
ncbi:MAG TPA: hypothetical protein VF469_39835 [Kofleriaceae bacterium]